MIIGFKSRRHWGLVAFFSICTFSAVAPPVALIVFVAMLLATNGRCPEQIYLVWFYAPWLLLMALFWPLLIRTLRLRYWQPWTTPDQWEVGEERVAPGVYKAAGATRPTAVQPAERNSVYKSLRSEQATWFNGTGVRPKRLPDLIAGYNLYLAAAAPPICLRRLKPCWIGSH